MTNILLTWLLSTISLLVAARLVSGIHIESFGTALVAAALLGILNAFIRPIFLILTLPINILTLGLFTLVINGLLLMMVSGVVGGLIIKNFWAGFWGAMALSLTNWLLNLILRKTTLSF